MHTSTIKPGVMIVCALLLTLLWTACSQQAPTVTENSAPPTNTLTAAPTPEPTETTAPLPTMTNTPAATLNPTEVAAVFPLAVRGPYWTGTREYNFVDNSRADRVVRVTLIYPALEQTDAEGKIIRANAPADMSGAPYPLVLTGGNSGDGNIRSHLASRGFVTAIVRYPEAPFYYDNAVIDNPLDVLFVLDQIAATSLEGLEGVIDSHRSGVAGYSIDGLTSMLVSGARLDPAYYLDRCSNAPDLDPPMSSTWLKYYCHLADNWDPFAAYAGETLAVSQDGLWQPITDQRILAVAPLAPDGAWLFGPDGLQAVDRPTLILVGSQDQISDYEMESVFIFEHLGTPDKFMISFIGEDHMMVFDPQISARMNHFVTAFFGYFLAGRLEYAAYFSENFVGQFDELAWGIYLER